MSKKINIGGLSVGGGNKPFIIAELSGNHQQSYELAIKMIEVAAEAGADAIKLQTYTADSMTLDIARDEFLIQESDSLWKGKSLHELYQEAATPYEWHESLFAHAKALGLIAFSSPFDESAVDFLEGLNVPCYKIASFENTDLPLIRKIAKTGKPVIISTGMASLSEIEDMVNTVRQAGCEQLILLKCTSAYPAPPEDANLATMADMALRFRCEVGLSDHSVGIEIALAATALGAAVIEKHFVLNRDDGGVDAAFSIEPHELKKLVVESKRVAGAVGNINYGCTDSDQKAKKYRRSLYISQSLESGDIVSEDNLRIVRPGLGLPPKYYDQVIGRKVKHSIIKGTPVRWDLFSSE